MQSLAQKKHKVQLSDYDFERDVTIRLLFSSLTPVQVNILEEILHGSLKIDLERLTSRLKLPKELMMPFIQQLEKEQLIQIEGQAISVNKEKRKLFEVEFERFSPNFQPDLNYLQESLNKVPIQILPVWYAIPKNSDNIFASIIERYFGYPKNYYRHLQELSQTTPHLYKLIEELEKQPECFLSAEELKQKYGWTHVEFEKVALELEYNLGGCLCYREKEDGTGWNEGLTLFREWKKHLEYLRDAAPLPLFEQSEVHPFYASEFSFIEELHRQIKQCGEGKSRLQECSSGINQMAQLLGIIYLADGDWMIDEEQWRFWQQQTKQEQALTLYRQITHAARVENALALGCNEKLLRNLMKALKYTLHRGWFDLENFVQAILPAMGLSAPFSLKRTGRRWSFEPIEELTKKEELAKKLPQKNLSEIYEAALKKLLFYCGFISLGSCKGKECFCLTPLGRMSLEG